MNTFLFLLAAVFFILFIRSDNKVKSLKEYIVNLERNFNDIKLSSNSFKSEYIDVIPSIKHKNKSNNPSAYLFTQEEIGAFQLKKIERQYLYPKKDLIDKSHFFYGKKVVITGGFNCFENRNDIAKLLWEVGADVDTGMGKYTEVLIVGDDPGYSKIAQAEDLGIDFITENEFLNYFELN